MEGSVQGLVAANPEQRKGTEDGVVGPTAGRYLEDLEDILEDFHLSMEIMHMKIQS